MSMDSPPIFCYAGREGFMVANELRPGSQHCEKDAVKFLERCVGILLRAGYFQWGLLVRVDSDYDASDFIRMLERLGVRNIVKRNLRSESREQLFDSMRYFEMPVHPPAASAPTGSPRDTRTKKGSAGS